jgi:hypothetical protein
MIFEQMNLDEQLKINRDQPSFIASKHPLQLFLYKLPLILHFINLLSAKSTVRRNNSKKNSITMTCGVALLIAPSSTTSNAKFTIFFILHSLSFPLKLTPAITESKKLLLLFFNIKTCARSVRERERERERLHF